MANEVDPLANLGDIDEQYNNATAATPGDQAFEVIPEDTRVIVVCTDQKPAFVGAKKTPVCKVTFEVVAPDQFTGKKLWHDFWLTTANLKYLKRDMDILGWKGRPTMLLQGEDASLINLGAEVTVGIEEYQSKDRNTGEFLHNPDGSPKMRTKNTIKFFNATYDPAAPQAAPKGQTVAPAPKAAPQAAPKAAPPVQPTEDTIPF